MPESPLKTQINDAMKDAMRAREKQRLGTLRLMLSEIKKVEVDERIDPDDARITSRLDKSDEIPLSSSLRLAETN